MLVLGKLGTPLLHRSVGACPLGKQVLPDAVVVLVAL